jgi:hypothetical protein
LESKQELLEATIKEEGKFWQSLDKMTNEHQHQIQRLQITIAKKLREN